MTLRSQLAAEHPLGYSRSPICPIFLSLASHKPGEANTVTPSWQVPLGAIQFPRETVFTQLRCQAALSQETKWCPPSWQLLCSIPEVCAHCHCATYYKGKGHAALAV